MDYNLKQTKIYESDVDESILYIVNTLKDKNAASSLLEELESCIKLITSFPYMCNEIDDNILKALQIRFVIVKKYLLFYKVDEDKKTIYLIRFLHSKMDYQNILSQTNLLCDSSK